MIAIGGLAGRGGLSAVLWHSAWGVADMNPAVDGATPLIVLIADLVYFGARLGRGRRRPGR